MISKSFGLLFYLKKPRSEDQKERSIFLRITVDGVSRAMSIHRTCSKDLWNQNSGRAIVSKIAGRRAANIPSTPAEDEAHALNAYIETVTAKVHEARHQLIMSGKDALLKVIGYFKADRVSEYGFESDEMLDGIISNAINLASEAPEVYPLMVAWWKGQVNHFTHGKGGKILRFFDKTGTRERLFIEIWRKATADISQKFLYLSELATSASISFLVREYNDRNATKNDLGNFYHTLKWAGSPLSEVFEREAREKGRYTVEKPVTRDFKAEIAARRMRDFAVLFDKQAWMAAVNEVFDKEGKEEIAWGDLFEIQRVNNLSKDLEDIYSGSALRLLRAMIVVYLVKLLEIVLPEAIMLDMLYFDYRDENTGGVLNYVETKISQQKVAQRVVENLKDGIEVDPVLQNYVNYAATRQLGAAYPFIRREIVNHERADYFRISILESYYKGTDDSMVFPNLRTESCIN